MRILHVCSDWKWTGPAEPMLVLIRALRARGHVVDLACPDPPEHGERSLAEEARAAGVLPVLTLARARGARWRRDTPDVRALARVVTAGRYDVLHAWHTRGHALAWRALRGRRGTSALVRSLASAEAPLARPWNRWLFGPACDGLVCVGELCAQRVERLRGGRPSLAALGAVDPEPFARADGSRARAALGIPPDAMVVGLVARIQPQRRFDLLFDATAQLAAERPELRLLILGRGTRFDEVARRPVLRRGLERQVVLGGYRTGGDYADALAALDVFTFLVPGSDGTCRALQQAMVCGLPVVATRRGALPEIVVDGETGLLVDETPAALAEAWGRLLAEPALRARLGGGARRRALTELAPARLAERHESLYASALRSAT